MRVSVAPGLNELSPVAVELLVVYDKQLLATLEAMTAQQWFQQRQQLLQQYETTGKLDNHKWEWVPGQVVPQQVRSYDVGVRGGVLFANYFSPGDHRATVDPFDPFLLSLGPTSFTVERLK